VWPDHLVIRTTLDERQNSPVVATTTGANITPTVSGISDRRLQEASEGMQTRESYLAERVLLVAAIALHTLSCIRFKGRPPDLLPCFWTDLCCKIPV
jgi:hypothetical protein